MDIGIIALFAFGVLMFFALQLCTKQEERDDPEAVAKVKKLGAALMLAAIA